MLRPMPAGLFVVGTLVLVTMGMTGCSGPTQTKAAACTALIASLDASTSSLNDGLTTRSTDPPSARKSLEKGAASLHSAVKKITNPDVKPVADVADTAVSSLADQVIASLSGTGVVDSKKLAAASSDVTAAFADVRKLCG